jgi:hypothetical protein
MTGRPTGPAMAPSWWGRGAVSDTLPQGTPVVGGDRVPEPRLESGTKRQEAVPAVAGGRQLPLDAAGSRVGEKVQGHSEMRTKRLDGWSSQAAVGRLFAPCAEELRL